MQLTRAAATTTLLAALLLASGCATTSESQRGALIGAGIGALAGNVIGGDSEATAIGAAVGAGIGYLIGNERDQRKAREMSESTARADYAHEEVGPLGGTRWELVDWQPREGFGDQFRRKVVEFGNDGHVVTTITHTDGTVRTERESYRVVGDKLIINKPGYLANYHYAIRGDQLTLDTDRVRALLRRM